MRFAVERQSLSVRTVKNHRPLRVSFAGFPSPAGEILGRSAARYSRAADRSLRHEDEMPSERAFHEASHCVVAHALGVPIKSATLDGVVTLTRHSMREQAYFATVAMAGAAGESRAMGYDAATIATLSTSAWAQDIANASRLPRQGRRQGRNETRP